MRKYGKARALLRWGLLPAILVWVTGCTGMVQEELDETHAKLTALRKLVESANQELTTLRGIVSELDDSHTVLPDSFESTEGGFKLSFKDGKTIEILAGHDGADGRVFPIGVAWNEEEGCFCWTIDYLDGEGVVWLKDADEKPLRAGAVDGEDGIAPEVKLEEDGWYVYVGEEKTKLADLEDLDGIGVFRNAYEDAEKVYLELWGGDVLEISKYVPVRISFDGAVRDTVLIAGGEVLPIPFEVLVEGNADEQPVVVTSGTDGTYFSEIVKGTEPGKDTVLVTAPAEFAEGYILLSAWCDGVSALKMITFRQREVSEKEVLIRTASGNVTRKVPYKTNFPYRIVKPEDASWLEVTCNADADTLTFTTLPNETGEIRTCEIFIVPENNPEFVVTTFQIIQATDAWFKVSYDASSAFLYESFDPNDHVIGLIKATAEGGDSDYWLTAPVDLSVSVPEDVTWLQAVMTPEDGFQHLHIHVDSIDNMEERKGGISIIFMNLPFRSIDVIQAGATTGESE
jgi:hypothetical protein